MHNAMKHSGVVRNPEGWVKVKVMCTDAKVELTVSDNGHGFGANETLAVRGWGIRRLKEVVNATPGGEFSIESEPKRGTTLRVVVNLAGDASGQPRAESL